MGSLAKKLREKNPAESKVVEVAAWGDKGKPFLVYCKPITCHDVNVLQKKHKDFLNNTTLASMVDLIIMKAMDESGERLFTAVDDRLELMGMQTDIIADLASQMFADIESEDDLLKN